MTCITMNDPRGYALAPTLESIFAILREKGLAFFNGAPGRSALLAIAHELGTIHPHRDADGSGITVVEPQGEDSPGRHGFSSDCLFPHTDASADKLPPDMLLFYCEQAAADGGESLFVDGRQLYLEMERQDPRLLGFLTSPDAALFTSRSGSFSSAIISTDATGRTSFRFRLDDLIHFSTRIAFILPSLIALIEKHIVRFRLSAGQGYIVNNGWWLHGRSSFQGYRCGVRILIDTNKTDETSGQRALARGFISTIR